MTLIDAKYYGTALRAAQKRNCLSNEKAAAILKIRKSEWRCYTRGTTTIPTDLLIFILEYGLAMIEFKRRNYKNKR